MAATETALINGPAGRIELIIDTPERVRGIALVCHPHPLLSLIHISEPTRPY